MKAPDGDAAKPRAIRHPDRTRPVTPPAGEMHLEEITAHVERHFGPVANVFHEMISDLVHIDVLIVEPTQARPWYVLVTSGMSDLPMHVPAGESGPRHAELVIHVASDVKLDQQAFADEAHYWPIRHLKQMARMPHALETWLAPGQTVSTDPPEPVAPGVPFCAFGVLELLEPEAGRLHAADGTEIVFLQLVPLYREELEWKLAQTSLGSLAGLFHTPVLRVAMRGRPNLNGPSPSAVDRPAGNHQPGRRVVIGIAVLLGALAVADLAATLADDARPRWVRLGLSLWLASLLPQGSTWVRWVIVALMTLGAVAGAWLVAIAGVSSWQSVALAVATPLWAAIAAALAFAPPVRAFYAAHRRREES